MVRTPDAPQNAPTAPRAAYRAHCGVHGRAGGALQADMARHLGRNREVLRMWERAAEKND